MSSQNKKPLLKGRKFSLFTFTLCVTTALLVGFAGGTRVNELFISDNSLAPLKETYKALRLNYHGKLIDKELIEGASRGMVEAVGDPYTVYFNKKEAAEFQKDLDGTFSGIGAELDKKDGKLIIVSPLENSPAQKAGLLPGDNIIGVDKQDSTSWSVDKAVTKIRGKKGTVVVLTIVRNDETKNISINRDTIKDPSVKTEERGDVGIIRLSRFGEDTAALTRAAAVKFADKKTIVLDLRGNGGGYLQSAQEISSLWLNEGDVIVSERSGGVTKQTHKASGDAVLKGKKTVVLIDGGSASASEIVAGALQDHKAATLVGAQSFGKGSVQDMVKLSNGSQLKVTIARWYTPNGRNISKHGISPDVKIKAVNANDAKYDNQLEKALDIIK